MKKNILVIFGNITFEENPFKATVHDIENTMMLPREMAEVVADDIIGNMYESYLIPQIYRGEIIFEQAKA